jgi:hypothetical protein
MALPRLVRRRMVWMPTWLGTALLLALAGAACLAAARAVYPFLAVTAPVGEGILVVEGWGGSPVAAATAERFATGRYVRIVTSGGPIERDSPIAALHTWAEYAAAELVARGLPREAIEAVPAPASQQDRTFRSAVTVRDWLAQHAIASPRIEVVTLGPHARRSRLLYAIAFGPGTEIGVVAAAPDAYEPERWWATSEGTKSVIGEALGWAWTRCCFAPGERGSHEESWGR